ncbi:MAG: hypothetical protein AMXMBFR7_32260 [Planctomycetota bacterium]
MIVRHQPLKMLTETQIRQFFTHGFLVLKTDLPREFHEQTLSECRAVLERRHGNPGNNILPHVPKLQAVFECPTVKGALTSILGKRYFMHPHRHMHENMQSAGGGWHKDSYWGYHRQIRHHRPWWAMIMYYPQDVTLDMGPTGVLPGRAHHYSRDGEPGAAQVTGEAGTCFLIHYDIWHRATANTSGKQRFMLKFEFMRLEEPSVEGAAGIDRADEEEGGWPQPEGEVAHRGMWRQLRRWRAGAEAPAARTQAVSDASAARGAIERLSAPELADRAAAADELERLGPAAAQAVPALVKALEDPAEAVALNAVYALATHGAAAIAPCQALLRSGGEAAQRNAGYVLSSLGAEAVPALIQELRAPEAHVRKWAAFALGENPSGAARGAEAIAALAQAARDEDAGVRHHAVEALGQKSAAAKTAIPALIERLDDADMEVAFNAVLALARLGPAAAEAVEPLARCLEHENRYMRGYAVEALHQVGTAEALGVLIPYLKATRWCETTTPKSPFFP